MNINYKQSQFELFPGAPGSSDDAIKPKYLFTHLTLSLENLVVTGIVGLVILVVAFSIGVERGKRVVYRAEGAASPVQTTVINNRNGEEIEQQPSRAISEKELLQPAQVIAQTAGEPTNLSATAEAIQKVAENISGKYTIQVASFRKEQHAKKEADTLKQKGYESLVLPKGDYSIVCVGTFENKDQAQSFSKKLKQQYKDFLIRRL